MDVKYDKGAIQEYIVNLHTVHDSMKRDMDDSFNQYNASMQEYSRLYAECEEDNRRAYNRVESAESELRAAERMLEEARQACENSDGGQDDSRIREAQERKVRAEEELREAESEYARTQADLQKVLEIGGKYRYLLEDCARITNDSFSSCTIIEQRGNEALEQYVGVMEKAHDSLYNNSAETGENHYGSFSSGAKADDIRGNTAGEKGMTWSGVKHSENVGEELCVILGDKGYSFPYTKAGFSSAYRTAVKSGEFEKASAIKDMFSEEFQAGNHTGNSSQAQRTQSIMGIFKRSHSDDADKRWNTEYMPLVEANIRSSVEHIFKGYISQEKLDSSLNMLRFMNQDELRKRYGNGFQNGTLGFNDGRASNIAHDIKQPSRGGKVGEHELPGSGATKINYAFVTAVHENLHMMSANDDASCYRRGIMVGNDEMSRAMNEAFTEYFTYLSCGGDRPSGGLYPGVYSGYHSVMEKMPILEKAVGRDCMMDAYFNNRPEKIRNEVDSILGQGSWDNMCAASYALFYDNASINKQPRLSEYFKRLEMYNG